MPCKFCTGYHFNCILTLYHWDALFFMFFSLISVFIPWQRPRGHPLQLVSVEPTHREVVVLHHLQPAQTPVPSTQHGYGTRRSSRSSRAPVPPPVSSPPPKRTRISGPGESSRALPSPPASTIPGSSHLAEVLKRPMIVGPPLPEPRGVIPPFCREARDIAAAMHFPPIPEDLGSFRHWSQYSEPDMVSTLSGGRVTDALYRISEGFYFGPHHLVMAALTYFEEKVHRKRLRRAGTIPLLFPRLISQVLEDMGYSSQPHLERRPSLSRALYQ
ncbi:hypothetical protein CK203_110109 [Vitis vinifera]|uniref:Uncharacterized protein n=1 Tax=Vitis vinifera TaxID=29760 RepID=A0A438BL78_VITVI|nr:hypothetical protein CK203_110109 [Vitis vinifera]